MGACGRVNGGHGFLRPQLCDRVRAIGMTALWRERLYAALLRSRGVLEVQQAPSCV